MDDLDHRLLQLLREDGRATNAAVGRRLGLTEGAVRHRIHALRSSGVLLRYTVVTRPLGAEGIVLVRCAPGETPRVVARLGSFATDLYETSGEFDLAVGLEAPTLAAFNETIDRIRAIPGVSASLTLIRMHRPAVRPGPPRPRRSKR